MSTLLETRPVVKSEAEAARCVDCGDRAVPSGDPVPRCMYHTFADEARWNLERLIAKGDGRALDAVASELYRVANETPRRAGAGAPGL